MPFRKCIGERPLDAFTKDELAVVMGVAPAETEREQETLDTVAEEEHIAEVIEEVVEKNATALADDHLRRGDTPEASATIAQTETAQELEENVAQDESREGSSANNSEDESVPPEVHAPIEGGLTSTFYNGGAGREMIAHRDSQRPDFQLSRQQHWVEEGSNNWVKKRSRRGQRKKRVHKKIGFSDDVPLSTTANGRKFHTAVSTSEDSLLPGLRKKEKVLSRAIREEIARKKRVIAARAQENRRKKLLADHDALSSAKAQLSPGYVGPSSSMQTHSTSAVPFKLPDIRGPHEGKMSVQQRNRRVRRQKFLQESVLAERRRHRSSRSSNNENDLVPGEDGLALVQKSKIYDVDASILPSRTVSTTRSRTDMAGYKAISTRPLHMVLTRRQMLRKVEALVKICPMKLTVYDRRPGFPRTYQIHFMEVDSSGAVKASKPSDGGAMIRESRALAEVVRDYGAEVLGDEDEAFVQTGVTKSANSWKNETTAQVSSDQGAQSTPPIVPAVVPDESIPSGIPGGRAVGRAADASVASPIKKEIAAAGNSTAAGSTASDGQLGGPSSSDTERNATSKLKGPGSTDTVTKKAGEEEGVPVKSSSATTGSATRVNSSTVNRTSVDSARGDPPAESTLLSNRPRTRVIAALLGHDGADALEVLEGFEFGKNETSAVVIDRENTAEQGEMFIADASGNNAELFQTLSGRGGSGRESSFSNSHRRRGVAGPETNLVLVLNSDGNVHAKFVMTEVVHHMGTAKTSSHVIPPAEEQPLNYTVTPKRNTGVDGPVNPAAENNNTKAAGSDHSTREASQTGGGNRTRQNDSDDIVQVGSTLMRKPMAMLDTSWDHHVQRRNDSTNSEPLATGNPDDDALVDSAVDSALDAIGSVPSAARKDTGSKTTAAPANGADASANTTRDPMMSDNIIPMNNQPKSSGKKANTNQEVVPSMEKNMITVGEQNPSSRQVPRETVETFNRDLPLTSAAPNVVRVNLLSAGLCHDICACQGYFLPDSPFQNGFCAECVAMYGPSHPDDEADASRQSEIDVFSGGGPGAEGVGLRPSAVVMNLAHQKVNTESNKEEAVFRPASHKDGSIMFSSTHASAGGVEVRSESASRNITSHSSAAAAASGSVESGSEAGSPGRTKSRPAVVGSGASALDRLGSSSSVGIPINQASVVAGVRSPKKILSSVAAGALSLKSGRVRADDSQKHANAQNGPQAKARMAEKSKHRAPVVDGNHRVEPSPAASHAAAGLTEKTGTHTAGDKKVSNVPEHRSHSEGSGKSVRVKPAAGRAVLSGTRANGMSRRYNEVKSQRQVRLEAQARQREASDAAVDSLVDDVLDSAAKEQRPY